MQEELDSGLTINSASYKNPKPAACMIPHELNWDPDSTQALTVGMPNFLGVVKSNIQLIKHQFDTLCQTERRALLIL